PPNVFKNERPRFYLANNASSLGKKISPIVESSMLAADRKWLTRRSPRDEVDFPFQLVKRVLRNVTFDDIPFVIRPIASIDIPPNGSNRIRIQLNERFVFESRSRNAQS